MLHTSYLLVHTIMVQNDKYEESYKYIVDHILSYTYIDITHTSLFLAVHDNQLFLFVRTASNIPYQTPR